ncbi:MAG: ATP12 family protein [Paracoccaceae bacterium]|jgi:chaperone required for assembly of F1-ATPase
MNTALQKRFWKEVSVKREDAGYGIYLDGKQLKTPLKTSLLAPNKTVAKGIAAEWDAVGEKINPLEMHLTRCANATLDKVTVEHGAVAAMLAEYGGTDLLCYRATGPVELVARQAETWDPLLEWMRAEYDVKLISVSGVMHVPQPEQGQAKLLEMTLAFDPWRLTAFHDLVTISGSLVLALAVAKKHLSAQDVWPLSRVDEIWQEEQWGVDDVASAAAKVKLSDFLKAASLMEMLDKD